MSVIVLSVLVTVGSAWTWAAHHPQHASSAPLASASTGRGVAPTAPASDHPPPGVEEAATPLGAPAPLARTSTSYRFQLTQPGQATVPVAFSPCRPVHFVVRPDHAPPGGAAAIARAVAAVSAATGLRFVNDGATSEPVVPQREPYQPERYGKRWAPVLIAWATVDEVPDFGVDIAGEAGPQSVRTANGKRYYVTGQVYLDANWATQMHRDGSPGVVRAVVEHELGHLVGLSHANDPKQIMYPRASKNVLNYQSGDLTGLASLGKGNCTPDI